MQQGKWYSVSSYGLPSGARLDERRKSALVRRPYGQSAHGCDDEAKHMRTAMLAKWAWLQTQASAMVALSDHALHQRRGTAHPLGPKDTRHAPVPKDLSSSQSVLCLRLSV